MFVQVTTITVTELNKPDAQPEKLGSLNHKALYNPAVAAIDCTYQSMKAKMCKYLLSSEDHSISLVQQKVFWTREEALANIVAVEFIELPMSERDRAIETEFDQKESEYT